jgi:hypothetical protein
MNLALARQELITERIRPPLFENSFAQPVVSHVDWNLQCNLQDSVFSMLQPQSEALDNLISYSAFDDRSVALSSERRKSLELVYSFKDKSSVLRFIECNRLYTVLDESLNPIRQAFGAVPLRLEVLRDGEGSTALICFIVWSGEMQQARTALRQFDRQWWFSRAKQAKSKLTFDFELV